MNFQSNILEIFKKHEAEGTLVTYSLSNDQYYLYNEDRSNEKFSPASTFKIINSLIALNESVISDKDEVIKWDGTIYKYPLWNRDQTLHSAFQSSCVWFYQELARRISRERYLNYFSKIKYGELLDQFNITTFWLDNSLKISAYEQVEFLKLLRQENLPFRSEHFSTLKQIMKVDNLDFNLYAKTGWTGDLGWYVGYAQVASDLWLFALNIDVWEESKLWIRQNIVEDFLRTLNNLGHL